MFCQIGSHHINVAHLAEIFLEELPVTDEDTGHVTVYHGEIRLVGTDDPIYLDKAMAVEAREILKEAETFQSALKRILEQQQQTLTNLKAQEQQIQQIATQLAIEKGKGLIFGGKGKA